MPPLVPAPAGFTTVVTTTQLRAAITAATPPGGRLSLFLPPGSVFGVEGTPIDVSAIELLIASDGEGAMLDAQQLSQVFIVRDGGRLWLRAITLANGYSHGSGGALWLADHCVATLSSCTIVNATAQSGGAIYCYVSSVLTMLSSAILNTATAYYGTIYIFSGASATLMGCSITGATALKGGAAYVSNGHLVGVDCTFADLTASGGDGAAMLIDGDHLTLTNSTIHTAHTFGHPGNGGAMSVLSGTVDVGGCIVDQVTAIGAGAIYIKSGLLTLTDST
eukprot:6643577-Prymnesium_polylepis.2